MSSHFPSTRTPRRPAASWTARVKEGLLPVKWGAARTVFIGYVGFSLFTGVGGFLTAPVATWYFFGDWRFWRHWRPGVRLYAQGWRMLGLLLKGESGYMLDVPLGAPPHSAPVPSLVQLNPTWSHGPSCGPCDRCCSLIHCPVLDRETGFCRGYNSFYWRYFNCGRFPSSQREIDYYACPKWLMKQAPATSPVLEPHPFQAMVSK